MKKSLKGPWVIIIMALLLVAVMLILGNQSFKTTEEAAFDEFNQRQLVLARGAAGGIELYFETLAGDLRAVGRMPQVQHLDEAPTRREIQHTFDQAEYSYYKYEDSGGQYTRDKKEENPIAYAPIHLGNEVWAIGVWAPKEDARQLIRSAYLRQLLVVGLSLLTILLESSYSVAAFYRTSKFLEREVETKTGELKESHERLLTVLDSLDAVVYVADMETYEILFVNEYLRNLFGDVVGQTCWQTLQIGQSGPCDFCTNEKLLVASGEPSGVYDWEFQNTVTGRWYEIRDRAIRWVDGRIVRLEIAIDITEGKRAEEALEAAHAFRQAIIDGVAESIMVIGIDYRVQLMNRAAREFSSEGADASESLLCHQISHQRETPCDGTEHPCPLEQVRQSGQPVTVVHEHYQANGEWRVVEVLASPLWGVDGTFQGIIESARDITERVRAEETLKASEERYRSLFDGVPVGLYRTTSEGQILDVNPALVKMLGYPDRESLLAVNLASIYVAPEARGRWQALMDREGIVRDAEVQLCRYDGTVIWARDTARAIRNVDPPVVYYEGAVEDITARKQTQAALIEAEKLAMAGKLAASLAHEISNPLQTVIGCLGLAEETLAEGEDVSRYLHVAHEELRRTADIVAQLRDLHRPSRPEDKEPTDVNSLLEQMLDLSRKQCESQGIEVLRTITDLPPLPLVADQIKQVFLNLLLNAIEAMPEGGRLQVSTTYTSQPAGVRIAFTDSGGGIAADVLPHVFGPFYSTRPEGLGLGLFISRNIVKQHGGQIEVDSRVGEGTTFTVWLPA
jgi:PAS domain S-box-containing protein